MPYGVTVGAIGIIFIIIEIIYISQRKLVPGVMMLFSFILLVLFIAGIIGTAIQLFAGPNINDKCNTFVFNQNNRGPNINTLAFLQQRNICKWEFVDEVFVNLEALLTRIFRSMLAGRIRFLDNRQRLLGLDDGDGEPSELEPICPLRLRSDLVMI